MSRLGPLRDKSNKALIQALFYEMRNPSIQASYTTKPDDYTVDGVTYKSLRKMYIHSMDPTELYFVEEAFDGNWAQWRKIKNSPGLTQHFQRPNAEYPWHEEWAMELETRIRARGIKIIVETAEGDEKNSFSAAKWLAEGQWKNKRGRPSKNEVKRELKRQSMTNADDEEDFARMEGIENHLRVVSGPTE